MNEDILGEIMNGDTFENDDIITADVASNIGIPDGFDVEMVTVVDQTVLLQPPAPDSRQKSLSVITNGGMVVSSGWDDPYLQFQQQTRRKNRAGSTSESEGPGRGISNNNKKSLPPSSSSSSSSNKKKKKKQQRKESQKMQKHQDSMDVEQNHTATSTILEYDLPPSPAIKFDPTISPTVPIRFFIIQSTSMDDIRMSQKQSRWLTDIRTAQRLKSAYDHPSSPRIFLIFISLQLYHGYAEMNDIPLPTSDPTPNMSHDLPLKWACLTEVPFAHASHLCLPDMDRTSPHLLPNGHELPVLLGKSLVDLFEQSQSGVIEKLIKSSAFSPFIILAKASNAPRRHLPSPQVTEEDEECGGDDVNNNGGVGSGRFNDNYNNGECYGGSGGGVARNKATFQEDLDLSRKINEVWGDKDLDPVVEYYRSVNKVKRQQQKKVRLRKEPDQPVSQLSWVQVDPVAAEESPVLCNEEQIDLFKLSGV